MRERLSIRSYAPVVRSHAHNFHQIVVPLRGTIDIDLGDFAGPIAVGHCVIIQKNVTHSFKANNNARFLVADLSQLPQSAQSLENPFATVSRAFKSFCMFADIQLNSQIDSDLETNLVAVFKHLLSLQDFLPNIDRRISKALEAIENDLSADHKLKTLASISALSVSQFKLLFIRHTGKTLGDYLITLRMDKARALLANTDLPINIVADNTGYTNQSAFTRRFQAYHGVSPTDYKRR